MSFYTTYSYAQLGVDAHVVSVEAHLSNGLPSFSLVGLPETVVKEAKERVRCALIQSGFEFPMRRITVNLAPADLPKQGGRYDLAIAMALLVASGQVDQDACRHVVFIGELGLSGELRSVGQVLASVQAAIASHHKVGIAQHDAWELALLHDADLVPAATLLEMVGYLQSKTTPSLDSLKWGGECEEDKPTDTKDFAEVVGQLQAKRAMEITAAGGHNLIFRGPPGTGKSMLAERLPGILPPLSTTEQLDLIKIYGMAKQSWPLDRLFRPFRAPHHGSTAAAIVGGGLTPRPGEISLAHHGVLFLDEFPEFRRDVLESLREPVEVGEVQISRARYTLNLPASFQLVAAMNPCPCGYKGHPKRACRDSPLSIQRYTQKVSGPLLDRFDIQLDLPYQALTESDHGVSAETSSQIRERVVDAYQRQMNRQACQNAHLSVRALGEYAKLKEVDARLLRDTLEKLGLSMRSYHRILKVALTISDLAHSPTIERAHLIEALSFRRWAD